MKRKLEKQVTKEKRQEFITEIVHVKSKKQGRCVVCGNYCKRISTYISDDANTAMNLFYGDKKPHVHKRCERFLELKGDTYEVIDGFSYER